MSFEDYTGQPRNLQSKPWTPDDAQTCSWYCINPQRKLIALVQLNCQQLIRLVVTTAMPRQPMLGLNRRLRPRTRDDAGRIIARTLVRLIVVSPL